MPNSLFFAIFALAGLAAWVFIGFYRKHSQGEKCARKESECHGVRQTIHRPS